MCQYTKKKKSNVILFSCIIIRSGAPSYPPPPVNAMGATQMTQMLVNNPMFSAAAQQYSEQLATTGQAYVDQSVNRFLAVSHLKTYFAVDTNYVLKKLGIVLFPFTHRNWSCQYQQTEPLPPRQEVNSPDLYIPGMYVRGVNVFCWELNA